MRRLGMVELTVWATLPPSQETIPMTALIASELWDYPVKKRPANLGRYRQAAKQRVKVSDTVFNGIN